MGSRALSVVIVTLVVLLVAMIDSGRADPPPTSTRAVIETAVSDNGRRPRSRQRPRKATPDMARVSTGAFWMGCHKRQDPDCNADEYPLHEVELSAFAIDRNEVTVSQYAACVRAGRCPEPVANDPKHPVFRECKWDAKKLTREPLNCVYWGQANLYCLWAGKRLPTEAEWEKAARWKDARVYPWGNVPAPTCERVVMNDALRGGEGCGREAAWVIGKQEGESPYTVKSMAGNLREWVWDIYDPMYYTKTRKRNPAGPKKQAATTTKDSARPRVIKGGSYASSGAWAFRASKRDKNPPGYFSPTLGFRCAQDLR